MTPGEIAAAVAAQEEHIKRWRSCRDVVGQAHRFKRFGRPGDGSAWSECLVCGVTETAEGYEAKTGGITS